MVATNELSQIRYDLMCAAHEAAGRHLVNWRRHGIDGQSTIIPRRAHSSRDRSFLADYLPDAIGEGPVARVAGIVSALMLDPVHPAHDLASITQLLLSESAPQRTRPPQVYGAYEAARFIMPMMDQRDDALGATDIERIVSIAFDAIQECDVQLKWAVEKLITSRHIQPGELPAWEHENGLALSDVWIREIGARPWLTDEITNGAVIELTT